jgi:hypothetical protein
MSVGPLLTPPETPLAPPEAPLAPPGPPMTQEPTYWPYRPGSQIWWKRSQKNCTETGTRRTAVARAKKLSWKIIRDAVIKYKLKIRESIDQMTKKAPNPKCRLYWCLIEFIDRRYSQSCWYFRPALWTFSPLTFSLVNSPPPFPVWIFIPVLYNVLFTYTLCKGSMGS